MNYISTNITSYFLATIKVHQVRLIRSFLLVCLLSFSACNEDIKVVDTINISTLEVTKTEIVLHPNEGKWYYNQKPFNGYAVELYDNGQMKERIGYYDGKKQGAASYWYEDGNLAKTSNYIENQLDGEVKSWWPDGTLSTLSNYTESQRHGIQQNWHANGQLAKKTNFNHGQEDGLQQAWLENGKIYVNYEVKNNQIFGLKRANLCYKLKDEVVQTK